MVKFVFQLKMLFFSFALLTTSQCLQAAPNCEFVVVIPSYNNSKWYKQNLDSVFSQTYEQYRVIYLDDASPDHTADLVRAYVKEKGQEHRFTLVQNEKRQGSLYNKYHGVWLCNPDQVVIDLDGDDWLAHPEVLANLSRVYADPDVWLTTGQFKTYPGDKKGFGVATSQETIEKNTFRSCSNHTTVLRSFYAGLFQQIKKEDLQYNGEFFSVAHDLSYMFPMMEMAGKHIRFIPDVAYVYNVSTQINDHKINHELQVKFDKYLREKKEKYLPIAHYSQHSTAVQNSVSNTDSFSGSFSDKPSKKIYITAGGWGQLFAFNDPSYDRDGGLEVNAKLLEAATKAGYQLVQADSFDSLGEFDYLIVYEIIPEQFRAYFDRFPKEKMILFLWEPPTVIPLNYKSKMHSCFSKVYTWSDSLVDNKKYFKLHYPVMNPMIDDVIDFDAKRLCTLIGCNKTSSHPNELYTERANVIRFFENTHSNDFVFYGKGWPNSYKTYDGPIERKIDYMKFYKFAFCYENIKNMPGYVTEKIFDCFQAGVVPIYWGAPNIERYVPKNCYIAREDFNSLTEVYEFISNMKKDEYNKYIENIRNFLKSEQARLYSKEHFVEMFMDIITTPAAN